ncbi:MAG: iron-sulfur cluster carrier protein ApbC [Gammaproteobacteria bacterium]|nr:iron-sulfur cluster carrier protein ApbC [Gammaproteobacteria bacterium]
MNTPALEQSLKSLIDPHTGKSWWESKALSFKAEGAHLNIQLKLGYAAQSLWPMFKAKIQEALQKTHPELTVQVECSTRIEAHHTQLPNVQIPGVKNVIAVASGKGGVGKSTVSVNLALALQREGAKVGLLDADIYGPSQPLMLGSFEPPESVDQKSIEPVIRYGLQTMSIGYLVDLDTAMIWRGPIVGKALQQLIRDTRWKDLDYLVVDLPPGTGDVQLTLSQHLPVSGGVIVTTPQDLSLLDARRAITFFKKTKIPVIGIVENMSLFACPNCGHHTELFGHGGGEKLAEEQHTPLLAKLPLLLEIREDTDAGKPTLAKETESIAEDAYFKLAHQVGAALSLHPKTYAHRFGPVVIEKK